MKEMASTTNTVRKSKQISTMLKQGFLQESFLSPPSPTPNSFPTSSGSYPARPSPTLFEMMSEEHQITRDPKHPHPGPVSGSGARTLKVQQERVTRILSEAPFSNDSGREYGVGDVELTITARDGFRVTMELHRKVLVDKSRFFAEKLSGGGSHSVEICECDDVEVYVETLVLMYCEDLKRKLIGEDVTKILGLLKVSAAIIFDAGIASCLEYLEAVPWSEEEEERVVSHLIQLQLQDSSNDVLQRISAEPSTSSRSDDVFLRLLTGVLQAKDDKARREMKTVISRLLREDRTDLRYYSSTKLDESKETIYNLCHRCLSSLVLCLSEATSMEESRGDRGILMAEIAREADNMQWLLEILIDRKIADEFVKLWADQKDLATLHSKIPTMYRHEISKITAQLCIAIGRGSILVPKDTRYCLLSTWLEALYDDFGWMRRASRSVDRKLIEDGLGQTILTLPLPQQQTILLSWFDRFINKGDDCPNIQRAFEVWWRRAFVRQYMSESQLQITTVCDYPN